MNSPIYIYNSIWKWPSSSPITTSPCFARCWFLFLVPIVMAVDDILHTSHPLLHSNVAHANNNNNNNKKNINFVSLAKWILKFIMWIVFLIPRMGCSLFCHSYRLREWTLCWLDWCNEWKPVGMTKKRATHARTLQPRCRIQISST